MKFRKVFVVLGALVVLAQVSNPDTIYFRDGTVIKDCKILESRKDSIKITILERERPSSLIPGATERLWKEEWYSKDAIKKIEYESGAVEYIHGTPAKAGLWTYALESFGAAVGAGIGVMGGLLGGYRIGGGLNENGASEAGQAIGIILGMAVGAPVGSALGVTIAGESLEQKGSFNGALVGSVLVYGLACLGSNPLVMLYVAPLTMPLGAVIGYNYKTLLKGDPSAIRITLVGSIVGSVAGYGVYLLLFSVLL